jgi:hypothetical protein
MATDEKSRLYLSRAARTRLRLPGTGRTLAYHVDRNARSRVMVAGMNPNGCTYFRLDLTIATVPARIASGNWTEASMTAARPRPPRTPQTNARPANVPARLVSVDGGALL